MSTQATPADVEQIELELAEQEHAGGGEPASARSR